MASIEYLRLPSGSQHQSLYAKRRDGCLARSLYRVTQRACTCGITQRAHSMPILFAGLLREPAQYPLIVRWSIQYERECIELCTGVSAVLYEVCMELCLRRHTLKGEKLYVRVCQPYDVKSCWSSIRLPFYTPKTWQRSGSIFSL